MADLSASDDADDPKTDTSADAEAHEQALKDFQRCVDHENENRTTAKEDIEFARKGDQWATDDRKQRNTDGRPCLTINKLPAFIRQVVNDARQNKPSIKVHPVDSQGDVETAEVINGLIRNIEYTSHADIAYDTSTEQAVGGGFGYFRIGLDYSYDDSFDLDISINRVANQFSVYGDPDSTSADSSDWNLAFIVERMTTDAFEAKYPKADKVDWDGAEWMDVDNFWYDDDGVLVAEYWTREEITHTIVKLSDGSVRSEDDLEDDEDFQLMLEAGAIKIVGTREAKSWKVTQRILNGCEVLKTRDWPGRYIPIVPVYGDEFFIEGKRYLRSMIHNALDAQKAYNFFRSASAEVLALAPRVPFIGRKGAFDTDQANWNTANRRSHAYLEYDGPEAPQRQPLDPGPAMGAIQEALNASDDMKAIIGIYDAGLGARSNETSGVAINARKVEGDVSTFHFIDNMARAIRHAGCVIIDLIPHAYDKERVVRVIGEDGTQQAVPINQQFPKVDKDGKPVTQQVQGPNGQSLDVPVMAMHDLTIGKYDLTVTTGPSYTTQRQEAAEQMLQILQAFPAAAPVIGDLVVKNMDWPGADEMADRLKALAPQPQQGLPPQVQQLIQAGQQKIQELTQENAALKSSQQAALAKVQQSEMDSQRKAAGNHEDAVRKDLYDRDALEIESYDAYTRRIAALTGAVSAVTPPPIGSADLPQN
jgi:hypothetical protein